MLCGILWPGPWPFDKSFESKHLSPSKIYHKAIYELPVSTRMHVRFQRANMSTSKATRALWSALHMKKSLPEEPTGWTVAS
jgi:hypothetical protein